MVQTHRAGEQEVHWEKRSKELSAFEMLHVISFVCLFSVLPLLSSMVRFCTMRVTSCKEPIERSRYVTLT